MSFDKSSLQSLCQHVAQQRAPAMPLHSLEARVWFAIAEQRETWPRRLEAHLAEWLLPQYRLTSMSMAAMAGLLIALLTLNLCRDRRRRRRRRPQEVSLEASLEAQTMSVSVSADAILGARQELRTLLAHIERLPASLREAFILYAIEERPQSECAQLLKISAKAVETRVYRARRELAKSLFQCQGGSSKF
jgi:RNA polymerase sigma factor (sigma-70 family)